MTSESYDYARVAASLAYEAHTGKPAVEIRCKCAHRGGSCGRVLGGVWRTKHGVLLVYKTAMTDAAGLVRGYKGRRGHMPGAEASRPGDRLPDSELETEDCVLLTEADDVRVSCARRHEEAKGESWNLNVPAVLAALKREGLTRSRQYYGTRPLS